MKIEIRMQPERVYIIYGTRTFREEDVPNGGAPIKKFFLENFFEMLDRTKKVCYPICRIYEHLFIY